ncbi:poly(A) RNA polymerase GLD2 [Apostasia shenzhenica]|uniref:Poly(A) RNA polymerase GLD2 n=1 Tax=Apostasia shenzhenica TaxID=1088818 RepID=A0A2I0AD16_9ASPA|nr:poly(A) RNA polymerase GLD2 [Apostasia shenzhenica]
MEAGHLELKTLKEYKLYPAFVPKLESLLLDVYARLCPTASDYEKRRQLVQSYNVIAKSVFGNTGGFPVMKAFGSFIMDIFTAKSDLDLSINFNDDTSSHLSRQNIISTLRRFSKVLFRRQRKGDVSDVLLVLSAKVPVLKAIDCNTGIECDISVENKDGMSRSLFFSVICFIDERFRIMSYLMKAWAKANNINSSKDRTMNSLSVITLVAFHLQLDLIHHTCLNLVSRFSYSLALFESFLRFRLAQVVTEFKNFGARNKESIAELFVTLLAKIEDFLDRSQNFARSVGKSEMLKIYDCIKESLKHLSCSMRGEDEISQLRSSLFGPISHSTLGIKMNSKDGMNLKPELPGNESVSASSSAACLKRKLPCSESVQPPIATMKPKKAKNVKAATDSDRGFHEKEPNKSARPPIHTVKPKMATNFKSSNAWCPGFHEMERSTYSRNPSTVYPILSYFSSQIVNGVENSFIPARLSQPVAASYYHGSHHQLQQLSYTDQAFFPLRYQHVAPHAGPYPFSSQYAPNPAHPSIFYGRQRNMLPGSSTIDVESTQRFYDTKMQPRRPHVFLLAASAVSRSLGLAIFLLILLKHVLPPPSSAAPLLTSSSHSFAAFPLRRRFLDLFHISDAPAAAASSQNAADPFLDHALLCDSPETTSTILALLSAPRDFSSSPFSLPLGLPSTPSPSKLSIFSDRRPSSCSPPPPQLYYTTLPPARPLPASCSHRMPQRSSVTTNSMIVAS